MLSFLEEAGGWVWRGKFFKKNLVCFSISFSDVLFYPTRRIFVFTYMYVCVFLDMFHVFRFFALFSNTKKINR